MISRDLKMTDLSVASERPFIQEGRGMKADKHIGG